MRANTLNSAANLLSFSGNVPIERTAHVMEALLGAKVSSGFVARAHERFDQRLVAAGFDKAMRAALRAEDVLCGDESPVNVLRKDRDEVTGELKPGQPHAVVVSAPPMRGWCGWHRSACEPRAALKGLEVLSGWRGVFVRDDYQGWQQFDAGLGGVQQCVQHLLHHLPGVAQTCTPPGRSGPPTCSRCYARPARRSCPALAEGRDQLDADLLAGLRGR